MTNLTALEKEVIGKILHCVLPVKENKRTVMAGLEVMERSFSATKDGFCSGFYTHIAPSPVFAGLKDIPHDFSVQATCDKLSAGEFGFIVFCNAKTESCKQN